MGGGGRQGRAGPAQKPPALPPGGAPLPASPRGEPRRSPAPSALPTTRPRNTHTHNPPGTAAACPGRAAPSRGCCPNLGVPSYPRGVSGALWVPPALLTAEPGWGCAAACRPAGASPPSPRSPRPGAAGRAGTEPPSAASRRETGRWGGLKSLGGGGEMRHREGNEVLWLTSWLAWIWRRYCMRRSGGPEPCAACSSTSACGERGSAGGAAPGTKSPEAGAPPNPATARPCRWDNPWGRWHNPTGATRGFVAPTPRLGKGAGSKRVPILSPE